MASRQASKKKKKHETTSRQRAWRDDVHDDCKDRTTAERLLRVSYLGRVVGLVQGCVQVVDNCAAVARLGYLREVGPGASHLLEHSVDGFGRLGDGNFLLLRDALRLFVKQGEVGGGERGGGGGRGLRLLLRRSVRRGFDVAPTARRHVLGCHPQKFSREALLSLRSPLSW